MSTIPTPPVAVDSSQRGFMAPTNTYGSMDDQALQRFLQQMVAGISGLDGTLVFSRFQTEPNNEPTDSTTDWAAVGPSGPRDPDTFAFEGELPDGNYGVIRHELLTLIASFYGANSEANAERFSLGLQLHQNREYLTRAGYGLVEASKPIPVPIKRNTLWVYGVDVHLVIRRRQQIGYQVDNVASFEGDLIVDQPLKTYPLVVEES